APAGPARPPEPPPPPFANQRRVYGVVYDLETLRPVAGARVLIAPRAGGAGQEQVTDRDGHYLADLFREQFAAGQLVSVSAPGYRPGQLEESGSPYRERSLESRRATLEETTDSDLEPTLLKASDDGGLVPFDLVVLPERAPR
ncbi:MAG: carboxypeptidase-like regulatory domain-containing protein, partial [Elusimicrobiota bacterium]|nr:carboxypeptidase-like regulatory domain-containing protein [Elusimicrobiota bacterium]